MLSWILWLGTTSEITLGSNKSLGTKDLFQFQPEVRTTSGQMTRPHGIDQEDCSRFKQRQPSSPSGAGSDCASWQTSGSSGTWGRSLKTGNEEFLLNFEMQDLPFMLICLLVEGFLIPPRWFFLVWNTFVEKKSHRQLTKNSPGYELCGSWTWPWRSWARDWSETRVCWATQVVFCHSIVTIACCTSLFGGTTSQLWQLQALTEGQG